MAKKAARKKRSVKRTRSAQPAEQYLVVVHSWIFLVAFALMLGMGVVVGNFINSQLNASTPQVAGYQISR